LAEPEHGLVVPSVVGRASAMSGVYFGTLAQAPSARDIDMSVRAAFPRRFLGLLVAAPLQRAAYAAAMRPPAIGMLVASMRPALAASARANQRGFACKADLTAQIKETIGSSNVVVYSKSYCPFCLKTKAVFAELGVAPKIIEMDEIDGGAELQDALASFSGQRTVPNVFINGQHIGGNDDTQKIFKSGKLKEMLKR
jgi:glutaredoxin 3